MAIFVSSFDNVNPFENWTTLFGPPTIVTGRTLNGALCNGTSCQKVVSNLSTMAVGLALLNQNFTGYPIIVDDSAGTVTAWFGHLGDGRFNLNISTYIDAHALVATAGPSEFVINQYEFYFFEIIVIITEFNTAYYDPTHSTVTVGVTATMYINNTPILTTTYTNSAVILNVNILTPVLNQLRSNPGNFIWDDVYINDSILGDGSVAPTDSTWDVNVVDPYLTQQLLEVLQLDNNDVYMTQQLLEALYSQFNNVYLTQQVLEIIKSNTPSNISIVCPIVNKGLIGAPYSATLIASGGVPSFTFSIVGGSLPSGLTLNSSTGVISGTATGLGTFTYTAKVTDVNNNTAQVTCAITITASSVYSNVAYPYPC